MYYDSSSPKSIEKFAKRLEKKTLREYTDLEYVIINKNNKGRLGQLIETLFFGYELNSVKEADFKDAGVELKVCPLRKIKKNHKSELISKRLGLSVKERLVISVIDYMSIYTETWEDNSLLVKIRLLLLMFYIYQKEKHVMDMKFELISLWTPSKEDMDIIRQDWEMIVGKVRDGKAHEISEGDTLYLGACTKGVSANTVREQPFSDIPAKQRAFSFKRSYVDAIFEELLGRKKTKISLIKNLGKDIEEVLEERFKPYLGKSAYEMEIELGIHFDNIPKHYYALLANKILGGEKEDDIEEFNKAGINMKTIRLNPKGIPEEHMSFPAFEFTKIVKTSWDESMFKRYLEESKFFFVVYRINFPKMSEFKKLEKSEKRKYIVLEKVMLWNMPMSDIENEAKKVWERTINVITNGIKVVNKGKKSFNNLPNPSDNKVAHVRPHARDKNDTFPLPNGGEFTKQSFWLNRKYIAEQVKNHY